MIVYVVDTETTGLGGAGRGDVVVEIGIARVDTVSGAVVPEYSSLVGQELTAPQTHSWIFENTDLTPAEVASAPPLGEVVADVRKILGGAAATSFNTDFDFGRFLDLDPWRVGARKLPCIMMAATAVPRIPRRVHREGCFASLQAAYDVLCPDDPAGLNGPERHRALSDAVQAAHVMLRLIDEGVYPEGIA